MEPTNKPSLGQWFRPKKGGNSKGKTVVEYLPDADEIERSPVPRFAQVTLQVLVISLASFALWASMSQLDQVVAAHKPTMPSPTRRRVRVCMKKK